MQYVPERFHRLHLVSAMRCNRRVDAELMRLCFEWLALRHSIMRTVVERDDAGKVWFSVKDRLTVAIDELPANENGVRQAVDEFIQRPFDLTSGPLFRVAVGGAGDDQRICVLVIHHAIADGWSLGVIWSEIFHCYNSADFLESQGSRQVLQFTDVMRSKAEWLASPAAEHAREYWRQRFAQDHEPFVLPTDRRTPLPEGGRPPVAGRIGAEHCRKLVQLAGSLGMPFSSLALAAFVVALARWARGDNVCTWVCHAGRRTRETMGAIGCFFDMWVLAANVDAGKPIAEVMTAVHAAVVEALPALDLPANDIGKVFSAVRGESPPGTVFNFLPTPARGGNRPRPDTLIPEPMDLARGERYVYATSGVALFAKVVWDQSSLRWTMPFDPGSLEDSRVEELSDLLSVVLQAMCERPHEAIPDWNRAASTDSATVA